MRSVGLWVSGFMCVWESLCWAVVMRDEEERRAQGPASWERTFNILVNCKSIRTTDNPNPRHGANNPLIVSAMPRVRVVGCPDTFAIDE